MKTIIKTISLVAAFSISLLSSCDMDKFPHGVLPEKDGIQTLDQASEFVNGMYTSLRGITTGPYVYYGDIQTDCYHAVLGNGGIMNSLYSGIIQPQMEEFETIWNGYYSVINTQSNYFLQNLDRLEEEQEWNQAELGELKAFRSFALFFRAYCYYELVQKFCRAYDETTANEPYSGVPISLKYLEKKNNVEDYLGRSTLQEVYDQIWADLDEATEYLEKYGPAPDDGNWAEAPYITINAAKAMKARVALSMKDYSKAFEQAKGLISSRNYPLVRTQRDITAMWANDTGREIILLVDMTWQHRGFATGEYFGSVVGNPSFIPTRDVLDLFTNDDRRYAAYLKADTLNIESAIQTVVGMNKYPGNPILNREATNEFINMSKPFRIAEQYLIAAEAAAALGDAASANDYLNTLRSSRINNYKSNYYTGQALINEIRTERRRELFGEGFRLGDLKRWGIGFSRSIPQSESVINQLGDVHLLSYPADDHRFVWPIPKSDIDANPKLRGQQNPGY